MKRTFYILSAVLLSCAIKAVAQKLPTSQKNGLYAPTNVRIDGDISEWGKSPQAYNKGVELSYTIANDTDNIYLAIQATDPRVVQKILMGGVTFSIKSSGASVIFPLMSYANARHILMDIGIMPDVLHVQRSKNIDSLTDAASKGLSGNAKEIKILGLKDIDDTITDVKPGKWKYFVDFPAHGDPGQYIPLDNKDGIKAAAQLNSKGVLSWEIGIPLKCIGIEKGDPKKFTYEIKLMGVEDSKGAPMRGFTVSEYRDNNGTIVTPDQDLIFPTNFTGEYILAKK